MDKSIKPVLHIIGHGKKLQLFQWLVIKLRMCTFLEESRCCHKRVQLCIVSRGNTLMITHNNKYIDIADRGFKISDGIYQGICGKTG